ncbi:cytochrome D1 domain-containing protein [Aquitalea pelogenes]|uniref:cytochrome D1 domain-containing protein n=1 Tax=Aquitalea pelogenes TaxID=1293573 RepID=UPI0035B13E09
MMKRWLVLFALTLSLPLHAAPAADMDPSAAAQLYGQHCQSCHGADRLGGMGPALLPESLERLKPAEISNTIRQGRSATQMAGFAGQLSEEQIKQLTAYVQSAPATPPRWSDADMRASHRQPVALSSLPAKPQYTANPLNLFVVVEAGDHHVTVLDGDRFRPITRFASHYAVHGGPKFSPDGRFVYFSSRDGWVTQYDLYSLQVVADIRVGLNTRNIAVSDDGNWILAGNTLPQTLVLLDAHGLAPVKTIAVRDAAGHPSRVSAVYEAAPRHSFVVALKDVPELWEISYDRHAAPVYPGLVHDYQMGEALAQPGFLTPRVTPLSMVLDDFYFDPSYQHVLGASRSGQAQVISLDARSKVADLPLDGMPHLGSGISFERDGHRIMATPNLKGGQLSFVDMDSWQLIRQVQLPGPGFFLRSHENTPYAWADSMMSAHKDMLSIIDKRSLSVVRQLVLRPGKTTAHVEFTRDGRHALVSVMENPGELIVVDAQTLREVAALPMAKPIGKYNVFNKVNRSEGTSH